jgi:putative ABC transport system substrate-binding protein
MLALGGCGALAGFGSVRAQGRAARRVGLLLLGASCPPPRELRDALAALGWIEGKTLAFDCVSAVGRIEEIPLLAKQLVARRPDVLVSQALPGIRPLVAETSSIPIVALALADPVGMGLIKSLARPGGNLTGLVSIVLDVEAKRIELLKEIVPALSRLAVVIRKGVDERYRLTIDRLLQQVAERYSFAYQWFYHERYEDIPAVFGEAAAKRFNAVYLVPNPFIGMQPQPIADAALRYRLPTIANDNRLADAGVLLSYGPSDTHVAGRAAGQIDKILGGAKAGDLPFEQPTQFDLVINLKTAKALGLTIPAPLLLRADRVIN